MRTFLLALGVGLAAAPAVAAPFQAVDASTDRIIFLDQATVTQNGDIAEGDVLFAIRKDGGRNIYLLARVKADCNASSMWTTKQTFLDETGAVLQTIVEDQAPQVASGIGVAIVETLCTGISPNATTAGVSHDTLQSALTHGKKFLAHHAGS
ncbi:hypothetical protein ABAC460_05550 [Asticcacaulis sp. AC460]|uniref:hypothetical protein n=1 Tax=Asticcacaulis sp. AC460 TaxID=1282360 RepID=UPI0003C40148|nr:hypothetical protein [Asticcacaulis sp. AC460]ESQ91804.1 hypothetical protein ABAC460_05550 [Asticcacaulis sp. AC460]